MAHSDDNANHGEILIYLLNAAAAQNWQGAFEAELLVTLCVPLVCVILYAQRKSCECFD